VRSLGSRVVRALGMATLLLTLTQPVSASSQDMREDLARWLTESSTEQGSRPPNSPGLPVSPTAAAIARDNGLSFIAEPPEILKLDEMTGMATVLANGRVEVGNSGDDTSITLLDPGLFRLERYAGTWRVATTLPLGRNRIEAHELTVDLDPARGLTVIDVMTVEVVDGHGFAVGLNRRAEVHSVAVDGLAAHSVFRNGLLWIDAGEGRRTIALTYDLSVERDAGANSGVFLEDHGHLRNQYWWHPGLGLTEQGSRAAFDVTLTVPADLHVALDFAQTSEVSGDTRTVRMTSPVRTTALSLAHDARWVPRQVTAGDFSLDILAAPDFQPDDTALSEALREATQVLAERFGVPGQRNLAVVQNRGRARAAWAFLSNQAIHAGPQGAPFTQTAEFPVHAPFGHEVAHLWTMGTGPLQYFLTEGWATYAEGVILGANQGPDVADAFWRDRARLVVEQPDLLAVPLDQDVLNGGVSYHKGAWVFAMLERVLGQPDFDAGLRRFATASEGRRDYEGLLASFGEAEPIAQRFLAPWVSEAGLPRLRLVREAGRVFITQTGPEYWLPDLELELRQGEGDTRVVRVDISGPRTEVPLPGMSDPAIRIDPRSRYLLPREHEPSNPPPGG